MIEVADQPIVDFARRLRREQTTTEEVLWTELRANRLGVRFR